MSSPAREPLNGIIRQDRKIVGGVCLPEENVQRFIDQFNHCYGPLMMKIDAPLLARAQPTEAIVPVGAGTYDPFRAVKK